MKNRKVIGVACAAALAVGLIGTAAVPAAAAGPDTTYLVLAPQGKSTAKAAARVAAAGGTVVAAYDQIGVLVRAVDQRVVPDRGRRRGRRAVASTNGLGTTLIDDDIVEASEPRAVDGVRRPHRRAVVELAVGHGADRRAGRARDHDGRPVGRGRRARLGHRRRAPRPRDPGREGPERLVHRRRRDTSQAAWSPTTSSHGTHVAGTIAARSTESASPASHPA
jgi:subtilisin family serine protease